MPKQKYKKSETNNTFTNDPNLNKNYSATLCSYKQKNYDIGHLTPAADMSFNQTAMGECFYFTNICPQWYSFNRGIWKSLENSVRTMLNNSTDTVFIISGVIWSNKKTDCTSTPIPIPDKFWKIVCMNRKDCNYYIFPNEQCEKDFNKYKIDIPEFIKQTGFVKK